jgi:hypothetical protein
MCNYFVICRGCPLLPDPARALARTESREDPASPTPNLNPSISRTGSSAGVGFPTIPPPRKGENQETVMAGLKNSIKLRSLAVYMRTGLVTNAVLFPRPLHEPMLSICSVWYSIYSFKD